MKIKILTLNIWGGELLNNVVSFIQEENPDIVLLQEVYNGKEDLETRFRSFNILKEKLNFFYYAFEPLFLGVRSNGKKILQGNAIFSRFPIENKKLIFFDIPFGEFSLEESKININKNKVIPMGMLKAEIELPNKNIDTYSVHGIWGLDGEDNPRRLEMSRIIVNEIKNKENVILGGDFNLKPNTRTIKNIEEQLQNVFKNELVSTFNMKHKELPGYATAVVDMIFVSRHFKVVNHYMPDADVSDHMPLIAEIEV